MISRRIFLKNMVGFSAAGLGLSGYARFVEPEWLRTTRWTVPLLGPSARPIRLLHLSDFHLSHPVSLRFIQQACERGLACGPDIICLTGDFITGKLDAYDAYRDVLAQLADRAPTFACLGNHDGGSWVFPRGYRNTNRVRRLLADSGITCLYNESRTVEIGRTRLELVGVGDLWAHELKAAKAFQGSAGGGSNPRILLNHNPDAKEQLRSYAWDLMLCGHTHGGQFYLPGIGTPFAPVQDQRYVEGLHPWEGRWLHITRGVGNLGGVRFNCRPEISVLELV